MELFLWSGVDIAKGIMDSTRSLCSLSFSLSLNWWGKKMLLLMHAKRLVGKRGRPCFFCTRGNKLFRVALLERERERKGRRERESEDLWLTRTHARTHRKKKPLHAYKRSVFPYFTFLVALAQKASSFFSCNNAGSSLGAADTRWIERRENIQTKIHFSLRCTPESVFSQTKSVPLSFITISCRFINPCLRRAKERGSWKMSYISPCSDYCSLGKPQKEPLFYPCHDRRRDSRTFTRSQVRSIFLRPNDDQAIWKTEWKSGPSRRKRKC